MSRVRLLLIVIGLAGAVVGVMLDNKPLVGVAIVALSGSLVLRLIMLVQTRRAKPSGTGPDSPD